jgi:tyramine---L-glutamate ligase
MRVFLYEFVTGGGWWHYPGLPAGSLLAEGTAMVQAMAADLVASADVVATRDARLPLELPPHCEVIDVKSASDDLEAVQRLAATADWTLLIAPETGGILLQRAKLVETAGGRLLSPGSPLVEIAGNKQATAELLAAAGVRVPRGRLLAPESNDALPYVSYPVIIKPVDGCGSQNVRLLLSEQSPSEWRGLIGDYRVEEFVAGLPASVAVLCGPNGNYALPVCEQRLSADGRFAYVGGRLPLEANLAVRGRRLALIAVSTLPQLRGYIGIDLVLGKAADGSGDYVIEINPRLTTSYVGLRALSRPNLAAAMIAAASGQAPTLSFKNEQVEFTATGIVTSRHSPLTTHTNPKR